MSNSSATHSSHFDAVELPFNPLEYPRENARHYISATEEDIGAMLAKIGVDQINDLFAHLPQDKIFTEGLNLPDELSYQDASCRLVEIAAKTNQLTSFIGDLLPVWQIHPIVNEVSQLRPLSTSYTPYQPERSQAHWLPIGFTNVFSPP